MQCAGCEVSFGLPDLAEVSELPAQKALRGHQPQIKGFTYMCMAVAAPREVPPGTCQRLVDMMGTRNVEKLRRLLVAEDIILADGRFDRKRHSELWTTWCITWMTPSKQTRCTCFLHGWQGHCPHVWAAREWWGLQEVTGMKCFELGSFGLFVVGSGNLSARAHPSSRQAMSSSQFVRNTMPRLTWRTSNPRESGDVRRDVNPLMELLAKTATMRETTADVRGGLRASEDRKRGMPVRYNVFQACLKVPQHGEIRSFPKPPNPALNPVSQITP